MSKIMESLIRLREFKDNDEDNMFMGRLKPIRNINTGELMPNPAIPKLHPTIGVIYIAVNPYIRTPNGEFLSKIGYSDIDKHGNPKRNLNNSSVPGKFEFFALWETTERLTDKYVHSLIDAINPDLREDPSREFYLLTPEDAAEILDLLAEHSDVIKTREVNTDVARKMQKAVQTSNQDAKERVERAGRKAYFISGNWRCSSSSMYREAFYAEAICRDEDGHSCGFNIGAKGLYRGWCSLDHPFINKFLEACKQVGKERDSEYLEKVASSKERNVFINKLTFDELEQVLRITDPDISDLVITFLKENQWVLPTSEEANEKVIEFKNKYNL